MRVTQAVELRPQPSADGKGEVRIGSICPVREGRADLEIPPCDTLLLKVE